MATTRRDFMGKTAAGAVGLGMLRPGEGQATVGRPART